MPTPALTLYFICLVQKQPTFEYWNNYLELHCQSGRRCFEWGFICIDDGFCECHRRPRCYSNLPFTLQLKTQLTETLSKLEAEECERQQVAGDLYKVNLIYFYFIYFQMSNNNSWLQTTLVVKSNVLVPPTGPAVSRSDSGRAFKRDGQRWWSDRERQPVFTEGENLGRLGFWKKLYFVSTNSNVLFFQLTLNSDYNWWKLLIRRPVSALPGAAFLQRRSASDC